MRHSPGTFLIRCALMLSAGLAALNIMAIIAHFPAAAGLLAVGIAYRRLKRRGGGGDAYGSARACTIGELWRAGLLGNEGLILGNCGYLQRPTWGQGLRALFSPWLPAPLACRLVLAAFFGKKWLER